jgi:pilus assembly protein CpaB
MILLLLALGCGLVASIGISQVLNRKSDGEPAAEKEPILVASSNIKVNDPLSEKNLKLEEWPKEKIPPDAIRDLKEVEHQRAGSTILSGEPMRKAKFAEDKRLEEIPKGYRVVGVPVNADGAAGNLLQPGDHVDVLYAIKPTSPTGQQLPHVAKTILQNIKVFAVNDQWRPAEGKTKSDESITAKTVSLVLNPDQSEILALATEMGGHIRLALRNNDDEVVESTNGTMEDEILHGTKSTQPKDSSGGILDWLSQQKATAPTPAAVASQEHYSMELLEGSDSKTVDFSRPSADGRWTALAAPGSPGSTSISAPISPAATITPSAPSIPGGPNL